MQARSISIARSLLAVLTTQLSFGLMPAKGVVSFITSEPTLQTAGSLADVFYGKTSRISNAPRIWLDNDGLSTSSDLVDFAGITQQSQFAATAALASRASLPSRNIRRNKNVTIVGTRVTVLKLANFILNGGTLTLQGTATSSFSINVRNHFSLLNGAQVVLSGGIQPVNVAFNVIGKHSDVTVDDGSILIGIVSAPQRTVRIDDNSTVIGQVIAANVQLSGGGSIVPPPVVSP